jgi:hypothetical protein
MDPSPPTFREKRAFAPDSLQTLNVSLIGTEFCLIGWRKFPVFAEQGIAS